MTTKKQGVSYSYHTDVSGLEEENRFLRESVDNLEREIDKFKRTPLISCEVREMVKDHALIRLPNGNEFMVNVTGSCMIRLASLSSSHY